MLLLADFIVIVHLCFILFVILGGLLLLKWKWFVWLHIPAAIWGMLLEFFGWVCPLTILENQFRKNTDGEVYLNGFVEQYIIPLIYPEELTRDIQIILGIAVILINLFIYYLVIKKWKYI